MRVIAVSSPQDRSAFAQAAEMPPFHAAQLDEHAVDAHLCALDSRGEIRAHCSLWWKHAPSIASHKVGTIGHYASLDDESAAAILHEAAAQLRAARCSFAVGPMDGNTWRRYRFVTGYGLVRPPEPPFFLEPANPPEWPLQFTRAGFKPIAQYYSALNSDLRRSDERIEAVAARLDHAGIHIRAARITGLNEQLRRIYELSRIAFTHNFLYTELSEQAFIAQYAALLDRIQPDLILLAERGAELVGYLFAIPDFAQAVRGLAIDTIIVKTVAILPFPELRGLGGLLVSRIHEAGHALGYKRAIHALMHEDNVSRNISRHYAETMRQYTLYGMELAP